MCVTVSPCYRVGKNCIGEITIKKFKKQKERKKMNDFTDQIINQRVSTSFLKKKKEKRKTWKSLSLLLSTVLNVLFIKVYMFLIIFLIVDLQCSFNFYWKAKWPSQRYISFSHITLHHIPSWVARFGKSAFSLHATLMLSHYLDSV